MDASKTPHEQQKVPEAEVTTLDPKNGTNTNENNDAATVTIEMEKYKSMEGVVHTKIYGEQVSAAALRTYNIDHRIVSKVIP
jgi:hypothetical protein